MIVNKTIFIILFIMSVIMAFAGESTLQIHTFNRHTSIVASSSWLAIISFIILLALILRINIKVDVKVNYSIKPKVLARLLCFVLDLLTYIILTIVPLSLFILLMEYRYTGYFHWSIYRDTLRPIDPLIKGLMILLFIGFWVYLFARNKKLIVSIGQYLLYSTPPKRFK